MKTVLFVPCYDGHIRVFAPLIKEIEAAAGLEPLVVFLEGVHGESLLRYLKENGIPHVSLKLPSYSPETTARGWSPRLNNGVRYLSFMLSIKRELGSFYRRTGPVLVITATDGYSDSYFLYAAWKRNIPTLCILSAMYSKSLITEKKGLNKQPLLSSLFTKLLESIGLPHLRVPPMEKGYVSKIAVWSERHKQSIVNCGVAASRIVVTGSPAHDRIYRVLNNPSGDARSRIYKSLDIDADKQIILYTSQPVAIDRCCSFPEQQALTESIIAACGEFDGYVLLIKLHPRESASDYAYLADHPARNRFRLLTEKDSDLYDLLSVAGIVITQSSTTGLDAVLFGKDMIIIDFLSPAPDPMAYIAAGVALGVARQEDLLPAMKKVLTDAVTRMELETRRRIFTAEYAYKLDGQSASRVMALINTILSGR